MSDSNDPNGPFFDYNKAITHIHKLESELAQLKKERTQFCAQCESYANDLARVKEELEYFKNKAAERMAKGCDLELERDALKVEIENIAVENCKLLESCDELVKALEKILCGWKHGNPLGDSLWIETREALAKHRERVS